MDVMAAAKFVQTWWAQETDDEDDHVRVRTVLENDLFVTHARPFTSSTCLQMLNSDSGLSLGLRHLHELILSLRHSVFAHSDVTHGARLSTTKAARASTFS
jgi:hypothetical protein